MKKVLLILLCMVLWGSSYAQVLSVNGKVTSSDDGGPLPGVSIMVQGTTSGTITDVDGNYSLQVKGESATLVFGYIGMVSKEVLITRSGAYDVSLEPDVLGVDEVVVVGYGVQKKSVVTGSIAKVSSEDFDRATTTRVENVMQGRTAGVVVTQNSGQPGDAARVRIRGTGSVNNAEPLWIVDGMPINEAGIDFLDPNDIQSVEVLKDAASAAIYGTRAANGVIIVTTKSGIKGKSDISYEGYRGVQNPWKKRSLLNATEYAIIMNEQSANDGNTLPYSNPGFFGEGTDWQDQVFNYNAPVQSHNVSLSGGSDKVTYYTSANIFSQEGIVGGDKSKYDRVSLRMKTDINVFEEERTLFRKLNFGTNIAYSDIKSKGIDSNSEWGSPLGSALMLSPIETVYQTDEAIIAKYPENYVIDADRQVFNIVGAQEITNPVADLYIRNSQGWSRKIVANIYGELTLMRNLTFRSSYNAEVASWGGRGFTPKHYLGVTKNRTRSEVFKNTSESITWLLENTLRYDNKFGNHSISALVGQSAQYNYGESLWGINYDLPEENWEKAYIDFGTGTIEDKNASGGVWEGTLASYFGRVNYDFDEKYMLTAILRMDGSSKFGPENKWGYFPSVSAGWILTNEDFLNNSSKMLSFLKVRASWGLNGNERSLSDFQYTTTLVGGNNYTFGTGNSETIVNGVKPKGLTNPDLRWEVSNQTDIGIDARFFNHKLSFTADYFIKRTEDMLAQMPVPALVGDAAPWGNVGTIENRGVELELGYKTKLGALNLDVKGNLSFLKNEVVNIGNEDGILYHDYYAVAGAVTRSENGKPYRYIYGFETDGIFQNEAEITEYLSKIDIGGAARPQPGDVRFVDFDNNGKLNDDDRTMLGNATPSVIYGFTLGADWKGFDASIFVQGVAGNEIYDATRRTELATTNYSGYILNRWVGEGTSTTIPRVTAKDPNRNTRVSDLSVYKGDFLRIKDLQLGYTVPKKISMKAGMDKLRFYVSAQNLLTLTQYIGFDPEIGAGNGVDKGIYPQPRTYNMGVNVSF
jgi:TonB-dependent starch-binding outer membrane protein SusC